MPTIFFGHLLDMLNRIYDESFADSRNSKLYFVANTVEEAVNHLSELTNKSINNY